MGGGGLFEEDFYFEKLICGLSNKFFLKSETKRGQTFVH